MKAALILLSGGLDSALNLALASKDKVAKLALTVAYGQKAEVAEQKAAEKLAKHYGIPWVSVDARWLGKVHSNALTSLEKDLPQIGSEQLNDVRVTEQSAQKVWVANRNGLFINIAAVYAEARNIESILVGFNREEAITFPDNSKSFMDASTRALYFSTANHIKVNSYTTEMDKTEIYSIAKKINLPLDLVWSCYMAGPDPCQTCESCLRFDRARRKNL